MGDVTSLAAARRPASPLAHQSMQATRTLDAIRRMMPTLPVALASLDPADLTALAGLAGRRPVSLSYITVGTDGQRASRRMVSAA